MNSLKELLTYLTNQFKFWFIIKEWENGLQLRNGRIVRSLKRGLYFKVPFLDNVYSRSKRLQDLVTSQVNFTTKDDKQITSSTATFFKITNIENYYNGFAEPYSIIDNIIKNESNKYFLSIDYKDFDQSKYEEKVFKRLQEITNKGIEFDSFKLTTFSNARTYRFIKDNLYSQVKSGLDKQIY